eukprot:c22394_g2_i1 orf=189-446(-)
MSLYTVLQDTSSEFDASGNNPYGRFLPEKIMMSFSYFKYIECLRAFSTWVVGDYLRCVFIDIFLKRTVPAMLGLCWYNPQASGLM